MWTFLLADDDVCMLGQACVGHRLLSYIDMRPSVLIEYKHIATMCMSAFVWAAICEGPY